MNSNNNNSNSNQNDSTVLKQEIYSEFALRDASQKLWIALAATLINHNGKFGFFLYVCVCVYGGKEGWGLNLCVCVC